MRDLISIDGQASQPASQPVQVISFFFFFLLLSIRKKSNFPKLLFMLNAQCRMAHTYKIASKHDIVIHFLNGIIANQRRHKTK